MASVLLLSLGHDFCLGTHSCLGAQPPLVRILPSHLRVKTKNKTKRSWSQMHPNGVGPVAFFWGTILARLGGAQFSLGGAQFSLGGRGPEMTPVAPGLHGCLCRKFTALVLWFRCNLMFLL